MKLAVVSDRILSLSLFKSRFQLQPRSKRSVEADQVHDRVSYFSLVLSLVLFAGSSVLHFSIRAPQAVGPFRWLPKKRTGGVGRRAGVFAAKK
jgi:hypothetical protein